MMDNKFKGKSGNKFQPKNKKKMGRKANPGMNSRSGSKMKIVLRAKTYLVVHKPAGMPVYSDDKNNKNDLVSKLKLSVEGGDVFPVHRLDSETCGLVLFALNRLRAADFIRQFKEKKISKKYLAFVSGNPPDQVTFNKPLKRHKGAMETAITKISTLERVQLEINGETRDFALVECEPLTGRFHQIRKHLKMLECPIVGDEAYGNPFINEVFKKEYRIGRTLLSAGILEFLDPISRKKQLVKTLPDEDFLKLLNKLEIKLKL